MMENERLREENLLIRADLRLAVAGAWTKTQWEMYPELMAEALSWADGAVERQLRLELVAAVEDIGMLLESMVEPAPP